jgi:hypothetical protein
MAVGAEARGQHELPKRDKLGRIVHPPTSLAEAVKAFNAEAATDPIGKDQSPLTEDEVIASIRGWIRKEQPISDEDYKVFQKIAEERQFPEGAYLHEFTGWSGYNDMHFDVWWVDLRIDTPDGKRLGHRIRARMIRSRPLTEAERKQHEFERSNHPKVRKRPAASLPR